MVNLTTFCADGTKQVTNMTDAVLLSDKKKQLTTDELKAKMAIISQSLVGKNYVNHKVRIS